MEKIPGKYSSFLLHFICISSFEYFFHVDITEYLPQFLLQCVEQGLILHHGVGGGLAGVYEALVHIDNLRGGLENLRGS